MIVFLDTEFTDFVHAELLSLGLVTLDGREHYAELGLEDAAGKRALEGASDFVRYGGVLDQWGLIPGAACTIWEIGRRTGEWLLQLHEQAGLQGQRIEIAFDYSLDYELMEYAIRDAGLWDRVREVVLPVNVSNLTGGIDGELAAEESFRSSRNGGLMRHHALADARALRDAYGAVKKLTMESARSKPGPR